MLICFCFFFFFFQAEDGIRDRDVTGVQTCALPIFSYMGEIGCGAIAKLVHNMIGICAAQLLAEAFTLGVKAGLRAEKLLEAIRGASYGQGYALSRGIPQVVFKGDFDTPRFALALARKDLGLATELDREFDVPTAMAAVAEQAMIDALNRGWGVKDSSAIWMLQEERA